MRPGEPAPEFHFCGACGAALLEQAEPLREERKVVTVLFADLVGFTSRAQLIARNRRAEGDAELQRALAFYRSVGARAYIARGEAVLATSA